MGEMEIRWRWKEFDELDTRELYDILALRQEVFVVEQSCPYPDIDGKDAAAWHLLGGMERHGGRLGAYLRVLPAGTHYAETSIGRVVVRPELRGRETGRALMREGLRYIAKRAGREVPVRVEAQAHLEAFYRGLGFETVSDPYEVDGIPHLQMLRTPPAS